MRDKNINYSRGFNLLTIPLRPNLTRTLTSVNRFTDIEASLFLRKNIRGLIIDIDGTLTEHGGETLPPEVIEKIQDFIRNQIAVCIFSNNSKDRTDQFEALGIKALKDAALKPHPQGFLKAMQDLGLEDPTQCAVIGDNFNTDGGCNDIGMHFIHVKPIKGQEPLWVKMTRSYAYIWSRIHDLLGKITKEHAHRNY